MDNRYNPQIRIKYDAYFVILCNYLPRVATGSCVNHATEEKKRILIQRVVSKIWPVHLRLMEIMAGLKISVPLDNSQRT